MGGEGQVLKRIPRIKFPQRHPKPSTPGSTSQTQHGSTTSNSQMVTLGSDIPAPPKNTSVGGKASIQPERTPVSAKEIEAILLGGCLD